ncbi:MerR family transcriptional regulator [Brevundimonas sp. FT23042]|uniref:MerR family transcriptional regulator n=1 Tax=Brevundimonas sp. FT23042 TaxID=3393749 RepID=UPI003B58ADDD
MGDMTISGLARAGGVGIETVRYYQRRGLLETPSGAGGVRRYGPSDIRRLRFIRSAQAAGFTLEQIGELLALDAGQDRERAQTLARDRLAELDAKIAELEAARGALQRLADACGADHDGPCPIIAAFEGRADAPAPRRHSIS